MTEHDQRLFSDSIEGWSPDPGDPTRWANTVRIDTVADYQAHSISGITPADTVYADHGAHRYLVEIDTHYKPDRPGPYPVRLTRVDALRLAAAVLAAVDDTFNAATVGALRPAEATELLAFVDEVADRLAVLREHAEADGGTRPMTDPTSEEC
ncbi:hypothetical protein [Amycolatopsis orientalis]|uniref:hypothetical protein n=1 Tax=Amycolatopsis orientalis TaxID=31958 RepID=UPI00041747C2|nr:hypothetical protein [Amycolatopsis orientalis]